MLNFKSPEITDRQWVSNILLNENVQSCEMCFGNLFMWSAVYQNKIAHFENFLIVKNEYDNFNSYSFPIGKGDLKKTISELIFDSINDNKELRISGLTPENKEKLEALYPNQFEYGYCRDLCDYVYLTEKMITLSGKKLHSKRNHITNFKKENPDWTFEKINDNNIQDCLKMHKQWIEENGETKDYINEFKVVQRAFDNYKALGLVGGLIRCNDTVVAYTLGEKLNDNTFCTHIEKAFGTIRGSYPIINQEFSSNCLTEYQYVNREEDLGIEGLRKAKLSYHPVYLVDKSLGKYRG